MAQNKIITLAELAKHNKDGDCWVAVDGKVYNVSVFAALHPGGRQIIMQYAGKDATDVFHVYHNPSVLQKYHEKFYIGDLQKTPEQIATEKKRQKALSKYPNAFGDMIPYGDPLWYQRFNSPYYKATHVQWRAKVRAFVEAHIMPTMAQWQDKAEPPRDIVLKMGEEGLLAAMCGSPPPREFLPAHIAKKIPEDFDNFHELILFDEIARCGHAGVIGALTNGPAIALTVVLRFGSDEMKQRVVPDVILGRKYIALAISEPQAGSDVAGTTAVAKREGDYYIANGNKKWITNGTYADYFATAFRTGARGQLSFFLVERGLAGFSTRKLNIRDSAISGTAYMDFDNCKIPAKNLIGPENEGFKLIMFNFNHERVYIIILALRMSRICVEECIKYALRRKAFGKPLSELQSIRMKISSMARQIEAQQAWLESLVYQLNTMSHLEANEKLGDVIAMCKAQASIIFEYCAEEATSIFGGNALYMDGVGKRVEASVIQVKGYKIPAGSQDVMEDFAGRMAFRQALKLAKL